MVREKPMPKTALFGLIGSFALIATFAMAQTKRADQDAMVITFKDGHRQVVSMADVDKIEFSTPERATKTRSGFLGRWEVGSGGDKFVINLMPEGRASKTNSGGHGTWKVVGGEARISWNDGWHDAIRKAGDRYEKVAWQPGHTFTDSPDNIVDAKIQD
jgi:hypothetical protein